MNRRTFLLGAGAVGVTLVACDQLPIDPDLPLDFTIPSLDELRLGGELLVWDPQGVLFLIESSRNRVAKVNADLTEVWAYGDEADPEGTLNYPSDIARGPNGELYVFERGNNRVTVLGDDGSVVERITGSDGALRAVRHGALHSNGQLYVPEPLGHSVVRLDASGAEVGRFGEAGNEQEHQLNLPTALAIGGDGSVHVVDTGNARIQVFDEDGVWVRSYGGYGDGPAQLKRPRSITVDPLGNTYVVDATLRAVKVYAPDGTHLQTFADLSFDGLTAVPLDVRFTSDNLIYVRVMPVDMEA